MKIQEIKNEINSFSNPEKAKLLSRFFKTGKGEYGQGDKFLGLTVPQVHTVVKKYFKEITLPEIEQFLHSPIHEYRMFALGCMRMKFNKYEELKKEIFDMYIDNTKWINNWDLIDISSPNIVGAYLIDKDRSILYEFAKSDDLWKQRIAIMSTFKFIKHNDFEDTIKISDILLLHKHDLIHKAVGWMLREIGKIDISYEEEFLKDRYKKMPRTMLRYAIEKFEESNRLKYLKGEI